MISNTPIPATVSGSPFANNLWMGTSGLNQTPALDSPFQHEQDRCNERPQILLVEDNRADVFLVQEAIELAEIPADIHILTDGERAFGFIDRADSDKAAPCPSLVILDLNLPKRTGSEVLEYLRNSGRCRHARVLIVTSSDSDQDKAHTARLGADAYFRKPSGYDAYMKLGAIVKEMLAGESVQDEK